jgi:hypothetical protein
MIATAQSSLRFVLKKKNRLFASMKKEGLLASSITPLALPEDESAIYYAY